MCHRGDADEGRCHCDLTAVLSAGSLETIRIHQPGRSVTFQPVGKTAATAVELLPRNNLLTMEK